MTSSSFESIIQIYYYLLPSTEANTTIAIITDCLCFWRWNPRDRLRRMITRAEWKMIITFSGSIVIYCAILYTELLLCFLKDPEWVTGVMVIFVPFDAVIPPLSLRSLLLRPLTSLPLLLPASAVTSRPSLEHQHHHWLQVYPSIHLRKKWWSLVVLYKFCRSH